MVVILLREPDCLLAEMGRYQGWRDNVNQCFSVQQAELEGYASSSTGCGFERALGFSYSLSIPGRENDGESNHMECSGQVSKIRVVVSRLLFPLFFPLLLSLFFFLLIFVLTSWASSREEGGDCFCKVGKHGVMGAIAILEEHGLNDCVCSSQWVITELLHYNNCDLMKGYC